MSFEGSCVDEIGYTAGTVWETLSQSGPMSMTRLVKETGAPRDLVMQAVGWLAREDKITIADEGRSRVIRLR